ncbi:zincin-like metallopeptidase domain-containing protein [Sphingomonas yabuuchiae]
MRAGYQIGDNCNSDVGGEPDALKGASPVRRGAEGRSQRDATRPTLRLPERFHPTPLSIVPPADALPSRAQTFVERLPATVHIRGDRAFYDPTADSITMPPPEQFSTRAYWASTLAHEVGNIASVLVAGGAGEGAVERYLRHLHCGEQSPGGGRLDARTAAGAATQRCGVIGIAAGASGIRRRLPASRSSAVLAR